MAVTLTSPVFGKDVGDTYTGKMEGWLLSSGYARRAGYTGPGVSNTGPVTSVLPAKDPQLAENREDPYWPLSADRDSTIANDAAHLNEKSHTAPGQDVDNDGLADGADGDPEPDAAV